MQHGTNFLHKQNPNLHISAAVERANSIAQTPSEKPAGKIAHFLARYKAVLQPQTAQKTMDETAQQLILDTVKQQRNLHLLLPKLYDTLIVKPDQIPKAAFGLEQQIAEDLGHGQVEITEEFKERKTKQIIEDQTESLNDWVTYLAAPDATYSDYAKYWAFTGMQQMGKLVKEEDEHGNSTGNVYFQTRTKNTVAPYPTCNAAALAMAISALDAYLTAEHAHKNLSKAERKKHSFAIENTSTQLRDQEFIQLIATKSFSKIYTQFLQELPAYSKEGLQEIRGSWVQYKKDTDPTPLVESLKGHPLEWCTRNTDTAKTHLQGGDFYVYYSLDQERNPTIPRLAIRMEGTRIAELRGVAPKQEVDPYITPIIDKKLQEFGEEGKKYTKKSHDMRKMTELTKKQEEQIPFTKEELEFLYEINYTIEGFGYKKDPRIAELRSNRDKLQDTLVIFECTIEQIANTTDQINKHTKAYIGTFSPGIFTVLQQYSIFHIYIEFPECPITLGTVELGQYTAKQLPTILTKQGYTINDYAKQMLANQDQYIAPVNAQHQALHGTTKTLHTVTLKVQDLGFTTNPTTEQLFTKAKELGLELCPPATGPYLRLQDADQPMNTYYRIAMEPITDSRGDTNVFNCGRDADGVWLGHNVAGSDGRWGLDRQFVFALRK